MLTKQIKLWRSTLGVEYTKRNQVSLEYMDDLQRREYGIGRTEMNLEFLAGLNKSLRILEVGCNIGNQLLCLQKMGFINLSAIELQSYALRIARSRLEDVRFVQATIFALPFKTGFFDLVFTSGVLIHIDPPNIKDALAEIYRCTNAYIWGFEYYAKCFQEIMWHGKSGLLWRGDYASLYQRQFKDLKLIREKHYRYLGQGEHESTGSMFLLRKDET